MTTTHKDNLKLFRKLSGRSDCVIAAPVIKAPVSQGWPSKVVEMWK